MNKAVDRFMLVDLLRVLTARLNGLREYKYFGLGGPFLEDFRLLGECFGDLPLVSLESSLHTHRRQQFHKCAKNVSLRHESVESFLANASWKKPAIYWLDYTDLAPVRIQEFATLLDRVHEDSIIKLTLRATLDGLPELRVPAEIEPSEEVREQWRRRAFEYFTSQYDSLIPAGTDYSNLRDGNFPALLQGMLRIEAERTLAVGSGRRFQILHSCVYSDNTQMYSLAGVVCAEDDAIKYRKAVSDWKFKNTRWAAPERIDMPVLSAKERLSLDPILPARTSTGKALRRALGYNIDDSGPGTDRKLKQYATFYRYYPQFARVASY